MNLDRIPREMLPELLCLMPKAELHTFASHPELGAKEAYQLARNSFQASFAPESLKTAWIGELDEFLPVSLFDRYRAKEHLMTRIILAFLLVLTASSWAIAGSSVWKAEKGGAVIYLGGTCHILRESDFPLPPEFDRAYRAADLVIFETDIARLKEPSVRQKLLSRAVYSDGSTIKQHLSAGVYAELSAYCAANGISMAELGKFRPSLLMMTLTLMELEKMGVSRQGVDYFFHALAQKDKKETGGLESVDEQLDTLLAMADGNENEFVTYSLKDMQSLPATFASLADAWRNGDEAQLNELMMVKMKMEQPKLYQRLIVERNRNWLPLIEAMQKTSRTKFVLVGVGHLVGPDSILEALKKKGFTISKL